MIWKWLVQKWIKCLICLVLYTKVYIVRVTVICDIIFKSDITRHYRFWVIVFTQARVHTHRCMYVCAYVYIFYLDIKYFVSFCHYLLINNFLWRTRSRPEVCQTRVVSPGLTDWRTLHLGRLRARKNIWYSLLLFILK